MCAAAGSYPGSEAGSGSSISGSGPKAPPAAFNQIEALITQTLGAGGPGGDWKQVDECWVLYPPEGQQPKALVHFVGGAFVGAAPQLAYRPLLEALAARGALVSKDRQGWACRASMTPRCNQGHNVVLRASVQAIEGCVCALVSGAWPPLETHGLHAPHGALQYGLLGPIIYMQL